MSDLLHLAAGVVMTGFDARLLDDATRARLRVLPFAGFILFARNVGTLEGLRALTDDLRGFSDPPPLIAVDQEGGRVARVREGVEELPPMMALGATRDPDLARRAGEQLAFDLRRAGVTHDFAPVVDLALDAENTVIGARAFGRSPELVVELAGAFVRGMREGGMGATLKHFPGHGDTHVDSHVALPRLASDAATLRARDLEPFRRLLASAPAVMAAHVVATAFDPALPASLCAPLLTGVLRDEWRYNGVCFTDCMQMDAIAKGIGTVDGVAASIAAGADCAIVSHDVDLASQAVANLAGAVQSGRIPRARLEEAYERVMALRRASAAPLPLDAVPPHPGIGREIARRAVTCVRGIAHADATASIVVSFEGTTIEGAAGVLASQASLRSSAPSLEELILPLDPSQSATGEMLRRLESARRRPIVLVRRARSLPAQAQAAQSIVERFPDTMIVCAREAFDYDLFPRAAHLLAIYGDGAVSLGGLADVIFGDGTAEGTLPF